MTTRTKIGDLIFLNSKSFIPHKVVRKRPGTVQVENVENGFRMFVSSFEIISIKQIKQLKIEIESILERNKRLGYTVLNKNSVDELQLELNLINNRLEGLK